MCLCCHRCGYRCTAHGGRLTDPAGCDPGCHLRDDLVVVTWVGRAANETEETR